MLGLKEGKEGAVIKDQTMPAKVKAYKGLTLAKPTTLRLLGATGEVNQLLLNVRSTLL